MEFRATGTLRGKRVFVTWADGSFVDGDPEAVDYFEGLAQGFEGKRLAIPTVFSSYEDHLRKPLAVVALFDYGFDSPPEYSGDVPTWEETPEGAIS